MYLRVDCFIAEQIEDTLEALYLLTRKNPGAHPREHLLLPKQAC